MTPDTLTTLIDRYLALLADSGDFPDPLTARLPVWAVVMDLYWLAGIGPDDLPPAMQRIMDSPVSAIVAA